MAIRRGPRHSKKELDLIHERTLDGLAAAAQGRKGGRPPAASSDVLDIARARRARGESVTSIAQRLSVSTPGRLVPRQVHLVPRRDVANDHLACSASGRSAANSSSAQVSGQLQSRSRSLSMASSVI
ncbi:hypothetical protein N5079_27260 [Planotetraspora sp. A-T 1434]|uniref:hypothetical protein n=1 Tax=Planotetraspora sp. A-T 1434 TaxID=2979219 RepID=UPI0021BFB593|nr:hypothetical protein [Planotetraspora sp. A-T 1434]MCT9933916.1 hypothetical protein [Planotetraspora sp. A-T 1434]